MLSVHWVSVRIIRYAALVGLRDYAVTFSLRTWMLAWYVRVLAQVIFFTLIGRLVGSEEKANFILIGNSVMIAAAQSLTAVVGTAWERRLGTLPLILASPTKPLIVFLGRGLNWIVDGVVTSVTALFILGLWFGVSFPWPQSLLVIPLTFIIALSSYSLGMFLSGVVIRATSLRNLVSNLAYLTLMAVCGVNISLEYYPTFVRICASVLPLTNGLQAIRGVLQGAPWESWLGYAIAEGCVGAGWLILSYFTFERFFKRGRVSGTIDLAE